MAQSAEPNASLKGRTVLGTLPKPKFVTSEEGIVVVSIWVDQYGNVQKAIAGSQGTTVVSKDLWTAARNAAMEAHFNMSGDAPALQEGTITYKFDLSSKKVIPQSLGRAQETLEIEEETLQRIPQSRFTFKGVLIDGTREQVESQLTKLGYHREYSTDDYLCGEFNGEDVKVYVHTHQGLVDRIKVEFPNEPDDVARIKYNNLVSRFERNEKFTSLVNVPKINAVIDRTKVSRNLYDATYFQLKEGTNTNTWRTGINSMLSKLAGTTADNISHEELEEYLNGLPAANKSDIAGIIWFSLERGVFSSFRIVLYYDNLNNRPKGEDL